MANPFESKDRQVITVGPETCYRAMPEYIKAPWPHTMRTYFMTSQPADWYKSDINVRVYRFLYGDKAVEDLERYGLVIENMDPVWVGGTFWNDPARRVRPVYWGVPVTAQDVKDNAEQTELDIKRLVGRVEALEVTVEDLKSK